MKIDKEDITTKDNLIQKSHMIKATNTDHGIYPYLSK